MSEAAKLFDQNGGSANGGDKQTAVNSAAAVCSKVFRLFFFLFLDSLLMKNVAQTVMKLMLKSQMSGMVGGGGGGGGGLGSMLCESNTQEKVTVPTSPHTPKRRVIIAVNPDRSRPNWWGVAAPNHRDRN